jgi:hypothetical protein
MTDIERLIDLRRRTEDRIRCGDDCETIFADLITTVMQPEMEGMCDLVVNSPARRHGHLRVHEVSTIAAEKAVSMAVHCYVGTLLWLVRRHG